MVGILVLTHGELGNHFIETARVIGLKSDEAVMSLEVYPTNSPESLRDKVAKALKKLNTGDGVLILTDLFGGTPTNMSLSFLEEGKVEVLTGLNLPMLIKAINARPDNDLTALAKLAVEAAKENIFLAGELMRGRQSVNSNPES